MSSIYQCSRIWLTIDIEELCDTNFRITWKQKENLDYAILLNGWMELCEHLNLKSTCFILGSFAKKHPDIIKQLSKNGHEIASHGNTHELVYEMEYDAWCQSISDSKKFLEDLCGLEVIGYRSASWSLPFEKRYYEGLARHGYRYSSSYFPFKTYMYGNSIDKKKPFDISTEAGIIREIPLAKKYIPFSGGLYLRVLPSFLQRHLSQRLISEDIRPIVYVHPYELADTNLLGGMSTKAKIGKDYILAFAGTGKIRKKIERLYV